MAFRNEKVDGSIWLKKRKLVIRDTDLDDLVSELKGYRAPPHTVGGRIIKIAGHRLPKVPKVPAKKLGDKTPVDSTED